jgi:hypothetical protein
MPQITKIDRIDKGLLQLSMFLYSSQNRNLAFFPMSQFLIYCSQEVSPRLKYVLEWIFEEQLFSTYKITGDKGIFQAAEGPKINYSHENLNTGALNVLPVSLLFEKVIVPQALAIQRWKKSTILFYNQPRGEVPFDLFAAVFYLISRYEEYLPYQEDQHGRFPVKHSLAFTYRFLDRPVVEEWLAFFREILDRKFSLTLQKPVFTVQHTFDVDLAWKYLHKGKKRIYGAYLRDLLTGRWHDVKERFRVLNGNIPDPYYSFPQLLALHQHYKVKPVFFILLGRLSAFDKNAAPESRAMRELMQELAKNYDCGIHPSYGSHESTARLEGEIKILSAATARPVTKSRQHYIKFTLPDTYRNLVAAGIKEDFSMGYASANGFRAGTSRSFLWYDLKAEKVQNLRIHPFTFMDATCKFYQKQNPQEALKAWTHYFQTLRQTGGCFVSIWHNFLLGPVVEKGIWFDLYRDVLEVGKV